MRSQSTCTRSAHSAKRRAPQHQISARPPRQRLRLPKTCPYQSTLQPTKPKADERVEAHHRFESSTARTQVAPQLSSTHTRRRQPHHSRPRPDGAAPKRPAATRQQSNLRLAIRVARPTRSEAYAKCGLRGAQSAARKLRRRSPRDALHRPALHRPALHRPALRREARVARSTNPRSQRAGRWPPAPGEPGAWWGRPRDHAARGHEVRRSGARGRRNAPSPRGGSHATPNAIALAVRRALFCRWCRDVLAADAGGFAAAVEQGGVHEVTGRAG